MRNSKKVTKRIVLLTQTLHTYMWIKPYDNPNIESIDTKLKNQWKYSPLFLNPMAETSIKLTGKRTMDYRLAEDKCGLKHESGKTVWHHVWEKTTAGIECNWWILEFTRKRVHMLVAANYGP